MCQIMSWVDYIGNIIPLTQLSFLGFKHKDTDFISQPECLGELSAHFLRNHSGIYLRNLEGLTHLSKLRFLHLLNDVFR